MGDKIIKKKLKNKKHSKKDKKPAVKSEKITVDFNSNLINPDILPGAVMLTDAVGKILFVNKRTEEAFGLSYQFAINKKYDSVGWEYRNPDGSGIKQNEDFFAKVLATGKPVYGEKLQVLSGKNKYFYIALDAMPIRDVSKNITAVLFLMTDITQMIENENNLVHSREKYKKLFNGLTDLIVLMEMHEDGTPGRVIEANEMAEKLLGYKLDEFIGKNAEEIIDRITADRIMKAGGYVKYEAELAAKNGEKVPVEVTVTRVRHDEKDCALATIRYIREKKEIEDLLKASEEKFRTVFEECSDMIILIEMNQDGSPGKVESINSEGCRILNEKRETIIGKHLSDFLDADTNKMLKESGRQVMNNNMLEFETVIKTINGKITPVEARVSKIMLNNRMYRLSAIRDISERKKAEEALKESETKFKDIAEQSLMGIKIVKDNKPEYINKAMAEIFEYSVDEMYLWSPEDDAKVFTPEDKARILAENDLWIKQGARGFFESDSKIITKNGGAKWIKFGVKKIFFGKVSVFYTCILDITALKDTEERLKKAKDEFERSNVDLEHFAYVASHDLQAPLRAVTSYVQLLGNKYASVFDEEGREYMEFVTGGVLTMRKLIEDLLIYARAGTVENKEKPVNLDEVVDSVKSNCMIELPENCGEVLITKDSLPVIQGYESQMQQIFQNLMCNAIKFGKKEGRKEVHVGFADKGEMFEFYVRDNGIGIDPKYHERVFEIFQRLHSAQEYEGSGIGLSVCKKIVERLGKGKMWVESEKGKGSTFYFTWKKR